MENIAETNKLKETKDTYILDALEVSYNTPKINFKVNYPFKSVNKKKKF